MATRPQMMGENRAGKITVLSRPWTFTSLALLATIVAPITPPIRAWLELEGIVKYHVIRFQVIAPISAANTSESPAVPARTCALTMPLAMVAATLIETNAPTRFSTADIATATRGLSAPVAIEVATALAVSWNPLVKSKQTAVTTTKPRMMSDALKGAHAGATVSA